ncbi:hypothetical protein PAXINDRAFT_172105 [Paxillus involutus ATCC 200175]|uniref:Flavin-containing monooxygenase n=1 Tax=Paxillus involutus ATCC 200175 TaxID=664439 RepID=A0A0C9T487_PAXIN|nr:hypothetical protein PAXINDRAFT_172105 [Paxillus involutus ATCC 200175]
MWRESHQSKADNAQLVGLAVSQQVPLLNGQTPTKRICVIGAGAAGLAVLKAISQTSYFKTGSWHIIAYEARSKVGGVWFPAQPVDDPPLTPLYDSLTTNLPHPVMGYTEYLFPPSTPLFPAAATVQTYLESYASHFNLLPLIRFDTSAINATWSTSHWKITISTDETLEFDHLVVANGHYRLPRVPDIPGLEHWMTTRKAFHSAWYRKPLQVDFGLKVLVVGAGPSGRDIATEMRTHARTVIHSVTGGVSQGDEHFKIRGKPLHFYDDGRVLFEGDVIEEDVDHCILATGFQLDFPFFDDDVIKTGEVPPHPPLAPDLYNSRYHVFPLAKYLFPLQRHYPASSVAFMALLFRVAPFPVAEAQARAIIQAFADPSSLDIEREGEVVLSRSQKLASEGASTPLQLSKAWFRFNEAEQWDYRDELFAYAAESGDCPSIKVRDWEKEMYAAKDLLRETWVDLERKGESRKWVDGVGENGVQEWVDVMYRLVRHARGEERAKCE